MNDCYWGGDWDQFYYEVDTGRIIGEIKQLTMSGTCKAFYFDAWNNPALGRFIDTDRARKAVERAHKIETEKWERKRAAWNAPSVEEEPVETPRKTWWKVWE